MAFPSLVPTNRAFNAGDYPIKTFKAQSGAEIRILYGNQRTGMTLELGYDNISDSEAQAFIDHYDDMNGSFSTFALPSIVKTGWTGATTTIDATSGNAWRYSEAPQITSVKPGVSSVQVQLIGVLQTINIEGALWLKLTLDVMAVCYWMAQSL